MKKTFVIMEHRAHEWVNRLWNDMSIEAAALHTGARVINVSALERIPVVRWVYSFLSRIVLHIARGKAEVWALRIPKALPPTEPFPRLMERSIVFFFGWMFRNPVGLAQYRTQLLQKFGEEPKLTKDIDDVLASVRGCTLIGLHLKVTPFPRFPHGDFLVSVTRVRTILDEYLRERQLKTSDVALLIISDIDFNKEVFSDFQYVHAVGNTRRNLFLLSRARAVIGTNTPFANVAAWFGNALHVVISDEPIDWEYYRDREGYFENKYATFTHGTRTYPRITRDKLRTLRTTE